ncbi:MAG TPA: prepilin-type N-terminal cleavage/methylation domain-containing protein [Nitrospirae bacterium]|nr:prepilin-type N-terminal cleavage/methylation domain-containing protein [Nitrospirota bacterium]HDZ87978.1 prepilin-type N-terminal cleavage/methylation domain-containing protein [Nitrospirota bacterium]
MKGFTLLEVIIALAIISGALITIIYTVNYQLDLVQRHETITIATILGREKILAAGVRQHDKRGRFPEPYKDYSYEIETAPSPFKDIEIIKLQVTKGSEKIYLARFVKAAR